MKFWWCKINWKVQSFNFTLVSFWGQVRGLFKLQHLMPFTPAVQPTAGRSWFLQEHFSLPRKSISSLNLQQKQREWKYISAGFRGYVIIGAKTQKAMFQLPKCGRAVLLLHKKMIHKAKGTNQMVKRIATAAQHRSLLLNYSNVRG